MAASAPIHAGRGNGRTYTAADRRRSGKTSTPGGLTHGHVWTTASVQGKNGRSATWSGAVMCSASTDAVRVTAGHDEFHGSGPNHLAAQFVPWPSRVFPIPA